jgi:hypothetical protein
LPATLRARDPAAAELLPTSVVKHVNGREGDSVVFGHTISADSGEWETRLLDGGYVVQQVVHSPTVEDVSVDDVQRRVEIVPGRIACVGSFTMMEPLAAATPAWMGRSQPRRRRTWRRSVSGCNSGRNRRADAEQRQPLAALDQVVGLLATPVPGVLEGKIGSHLDFAGTTEPRNQLRMLATEPGHYPPRGHQPQGVGIRLVVDDGVERDQPTKEVRTQERAAGRRIRLPVDQDPSSPDPGLGHLAVIPQVRRELHVSIGKRALNARQGGLDVDHCCPTISRSAFCPNGGAR